MKQKVMSALKWLAAARLAGQLITWALTLIVIRLLDPADYGLMAIAMIFISFCTLLNELGLGSALIQIKELTDTSIKKVYGLVILINGVLFILLTISAPLIAEFFAEEQLIAILRVLAFQFLIMSFAVVPEALLERALDFKKKSIAFLIAVVAGGFVTLVLAMKGLDVWALVWGNLSVVLLKTIGINIIAPRLYAPTLNVFGIRDLVTFGGLVTLQRIMWFFYTQADVFIAGKILGKESLGFYNVAMHIGTLPMKKVSGILNQIALPAFSQIQDDKENVRAYLLKAVRLMSLIAFPVFWGISIIAADIVTIILTDKWEGAIFPLQILTLIVPLRMISNLMPSVMQGVGRADIGVKNLLVASLIMPPAFLVGSQWGIVGISVAWALAFPVVFVINIARCLRAIELPFMEFVGAMMRPAVAAGIMYVILLLWSLISRDNLSGVYRLAFIIVGGIAIYGMLNVLMNRGALKEAHGLFSR